MWNRRVLRAARTERWKREDAATRLTDEIPTLQSLKLVLKDSRGEHGVPGTERTQHIIVARAASLFEIGCPEPKCEEGGHDLTSEIMSALRGRAVNFEGTSQCRGYLAAGPCPCAIHYTVRAGYTEVATPPR